MTQAPNVSSGASILFTPDKTIVGATLSFSLYTFTMRSKSVKPSAYPKLPFHGIRFLIFLSSAVVAIILAVFIYHLHADGYKLPFAFLIVSLSQHDHAVSNLTKTPLSSSSPPSSPF